MRILILNWWDSTNPQAGGAERHLHEIFGRIARQGAAVTLLCCRYPRCRLEEQVGGIRVVRCGTPRTLNLLAPVWLRARAVQFDLVVEYTNKIPFLTPIYAPTRRLCVAHHLNGVTFQYEFPFPAARLFATLERVIYRRIYRGERFTAVSKSTADELIQLCVQPGRVHIVHNGSDHLTGDSAAPRSRTPLLLYTGRLRRYKKIDQLLHVLRALRAEIPEVSLAIIGEGNDRRRLIALARELKLTECIIFDGAVRDEILSRWLSAAWVAVNPSAKEGWGLGVMEAARYGVPTVGSAVPGLRDSILDGETGLLVPPDDPARLFDALSRLLGDAAYRQLLGENARQWANTFRWANAAAETLRVIETL